MYWLRSRYGAGFRPLAFAAMTPAAPARSADVGVGHRCSRQRSGCDGSPACTCACCTAPAGALFGEPLPLTVGGRR